LAFDASRWRRSVPRAACAVATLTLLRVAFSTEAAKAGFRDGKLMDDADAPESLVD
jgi:hypothetical protein